MKRFVLLGFALLAVVGVLAATASASAAGDTACTGALGAVTVDGNLIVPAGAVCLLTGTHVTGNVTAEQGSPSAVLRIRGATIDGNVQVQQGANSVIGFSTVVGGNYQCEQCRFADVHVSTINGNYQDNSLTEGVFADGNTIGGNL